MIWLVSISLYFYPITSQHAFYNCKHSCVREELSDVVFFQTKIQQTTAQEHLFGEFSLVHHNFVPWISPTDNLPFTYHFPSVYIPINNTLNCITICMVENFQRYQRKINILDNPLWRGCCHFWFPYILDSSGNLLWCR